MSEELPDYLLSDVLFWKMRAPSDYPKLSLRQMLLTRAHLRAASPGLSPADQTRLAEAERLSAAALRPRPVAAENKARTELHSRLDL